MEEILEKIEKVLIAEVETHSAMITSSHEFCEAIKSGETETIDQKRARNDEMICTLEHLEEQRSEYCNEAAHKLCILKTPLKLAMLTAKIPAEWKLRIEKQHQALKAKINELTKINTSNRILLEEGLKVIGETFSCMKKCGDRLSGYGNRGQTMSSSMISIINRTA